MSLDQTAEQTGVSKSMLAQIERGTANPSLGVLGKVTSGLRIEFQELIQPPREDCLLVTPQSWKGNTGYGPVCRMKTQDL